MSMWKKQFIALAAILALGACSASPPVPTNNYYRLDPKPEAMAKDIPALSGTIEVSRFVADGSVSNRPLLYSNPNSPNAVSEYSYHFWSESPPVLLKGALISYLRASGAAGRVVTPELRVKADYEVVGRIKRLEVVTGSNYMGRVSVEMGLRSTESGELVTLADYDAEVAASSNSVGAAVSAVEVAIEQVFARFVDDFKNR